MKSLAYTITALAFAGALAISNPARAEEMQVSGTLVDAQVESHFIPDPGDPTRGFGVEKFVGADSSDLLGSLLETDVGTFQVDLKQGQSKGQGSIFSRNSEGTVIGSYAGKSTFTMDEKTHAPQGTYEGTWEFSGGTGRFANLRGHGTTKGEFSGGQFTGHWSGTITGFEKRASSQ